MTCGAICINTWLRFSRELVLLTRYIRTSEAWRSSLRGIRLLRGIRQARVRHKRVWEQLQARQGRDWEIIIPRLAERMVQDFWSIPLLRQEVQAHIGQILAMSALVRLMRFSSLLVGISALVTLLACFMAVSATARITLARMLARACRIAEDVRKRGRTPLNKDGVR